MHRGSPPLQNRPDLSPALLTSRYDIAANAAVAITNDQRRLMLQAWRIGSNPCCTANRKTWQCTDWWWQRTNQTCARHRATVKRRRIWGQQAWLFAIRPAQLKLH